MPYCYYTCNLVPAAFLSGAGYEPRWFGALALDGEYAGRADSPNVHPMTCPFVTRLVTAAERLLAAAPAEDRVVVPGGCDAMRRAGDLLAAAYPDQVRTFRLPRFSDDGALRELTQELERLEQWLRAPAGGDAAGAGAAAGAAPEGGSGDLRRGFEWPSAARSGGVFVVGGPLSDDSLLKLVLRLGSWISGVESCTAPARWQALDVLEGGAGGNADGGVGDNASADATAGAACRPVSGAACGAPAAPAASASGCGAGRGATSTPNWRRTRSATSSSNELECVFLSATPSSGNSSRIRMGLTSRSRASSLIRILLIVSCASHSTCEALSG